MAVEIITKEDLQLFRRQLLEDLQLLLSKQQPVQEVPVLKSADVRRMLQISPSTLQNLRINGTLPYVRIGGSFYYRSEDIRKLLEVKRNA